MGEEPKKYENPDAVDRREAFVAEYMVDFDVARAAQVVGIQTRTAYKMLREPAVREAITEAQAARRDVLAIEKNTILRELALIAFGSLKNYQEYLQTGDLSLMENDHAAALSEVTQESFMRGEDAVTKVKVKMADKTRALELLGKYQALWTDKVALGGEGGAPINMNVTVTYRKKGEPR